MLEVFLCYSRLKKMQEEMEKRNNDLAEALATIERLQRQLEETQVWSYRSQTKFLI